MNSEKPANLSPAVPLIMSFASFAGFLASVALNVIVARQVLGVFFLTLVPGFLFLRILRMKGFGWVETLTFSVGLSLVFLMIVGLFTNLLGPFIGFQEPLSTATIVPVLSGAILVLSLIDYLQAKRHSVSFDIGSFKLEPRTIVICSFPFLSVAAVFLVNASPSNNILLLLTIAIVSFMVLIAASEKLIPRRLYPLLLLMIALTLLLQSPLISSHINGYDDQREYQFMKATVQNSRWIPDISDDFQSLMSVTIVPAIYWNTLNLDGVWIIKILYPMIFALVPLVLYAFFRNWVSERWAFLASFFLIANNVFFTEMLTLGRQMMAELFFVLLLYVIFTKENNRSTNFSIFALFSFGLVASHYAVSFIFLIVIVTGWLILSLLKRSPTVKVANLRFTHIILYCAILLTWYVYVAASSTFNRIVEVFDSVYTHIATEFFNPAARGQVALSAVGLVNAPPTIVQIVGRVFFYLTEILIAVGFIAMVIKRKKVFDKNYAVIMSIGFAFLVMAIVLPNFSINLGTGRLYHVMLLILAPLFILGCKTIFSFIPRFRNENLAISLSLIVLVPFFLFQTGFVYEIAKVQNYSIPLSLYRFGPTEYVMLGVISDEDVVSTKWLNKYDIKGSATIYSDGLAWGQLVTAGYGMFSLNRSIAITSKTAEIEGHSIVYLTWANFKYGQMYTDMNLNTSDYIHSKLDNVFIIYSNGANLIYWNP